MFRISLLAVLLLASVAEAQEAPTEADYYPITRFEVPEGEVLEAPPASFFMRAESWFFGLLPLEEQM